MMIAAFVALSLSANVNAQDQKMHIRGNGNAEARNGSGWMEKMKAARVAFLTNELDLTAEEAQAFWPVYNQAQEEKDAAFKATRAAYREMTAAVKEGKSDKEIAVLLDKYLKAAKVPAELDAEFMPEYLKVLPATKVAKLYASEEKFRKMQFQNMQGHGRNPGGPRDGEVQGQRPSRDGQFQRGQRGQRNGSQLEENAGTQM